MAGGCFGVVGSRLSDCVMGRGGLRDGGMGDGQIYYIRFGKWAKTLANPAVLFYALPWLMILLVMGTLAQRDLGIYEAQKLFFSAWVLWLGPLPLPGAYATLGVITLSLLAKFMLYSPWRWSQAGIILTHLGVLILLLGGIVTAFSQQEGFIALGEGKKGSTVSDYHNRVLRIERSGEILTEIPFENLTVKSAFENPQLPFSFIVDDVCTNCRPVAVKSGTGRRGLAQKIELRDAPPEKENEANLSGMTLSITHAGKDQDGVYVMMEEIPHRPVITHKDEIYVFSVERAQTVLPFAVELKNFERDMHPGTDMARGFSSDVVVHDGDVAWPYRIGMNEPLRYKGYTFYQASFSVRPDGEYSILSVVRNKGRVFPYMASAIIFVGLLLHIAIRLQAVKRGKP